MIPQPTMDSAFSRRARLHSLITKERIDREVLTELLPEGAPHLYERELWDYKEHLPQPPANGDKQAKEAYEAELAQIVKDAVSFYNSYGGYLVIGIKNQPRELIGCDGRFDCDLLNRMIKAATRQDIGCGYAVFDVEKSGAKLQLGLLFVPQRPDTMIPAKFLKDAPPNQQKKKAYKQGSVYFRQGDECRPAESAEDYMFLCTQGRRQFQTTVATAEPAPLDNNLRTRDPGFIRFVGRDEYLQHLWQWLCDRFSPGKLLTGIGGVGKTTVAREFAEQIVKSPTMGFERVIWFSAKKKYYTAILGQYQPTTRVDFSDTDSLLRSLLPELGILDREIDPDWTREDLVEEVIKALKIFPSFVVIDDVDSLDSEYQSDLFQTILFVMGQALSGKNVSSRVLLTARLTLGAAPSQMIPIHGLEFMEFADYVKMTAASIGLAWSPSETQLKEFHKVTVGSPTFASSILRLVSYGQSLRTALDKWEGNDGEKVREFAFRNELDNLKDSRIRTLYALCLLGETTQLELQEVTNSNEVAINDDIGDLRAYHLIATGSDASKAGATLILPDWIRLMTEEIGKRVRDAKHIADQCARARKHAPRIEGDIGQINHRILALWHSGNAEDALQEIKQADKDYPRNPDLKCLLARAYLRLTPPDARNANGQFAKAFKLKCTRPEMLGSWIEAKKLLGDWRGIVEITRSATSEPMSADNVYIRAEAYGQLGELALRAGQLQSAADHYVAGVQEIDDAFTANPAISRVGELKKLKAMLLESHVLAFDRLVPNADEHIEVWGSAVKAFRNAAHSPTLVQVGVNRLMSWWSAVEKRSKHSANTAETLARQLQQLAWMIKILRDEGYTDLKFLSAVEDNRKYLEQRLTRYTGRRGA